MTLNININLLQDNNGVPGEAITQDQITINDSFFVEIEAGDIRDDAAGIIGLTLDIEWDAAVLEALDTDATSTITSSLPLNPQGTIDNDNGIIDDLGAGAIPNFNLGEAIGVNQLERFALLHFQGELATDTPTPITVTVSDPRSVAFADGLAFDGTAEIEAQILEITSDDNPPVVANEIADVTVNEDAEDTVIDLSSVFSDRDNDNTAIGKSISLNSNEDLVTAMIEGNNLILDYQPNQSGIAEITIEAESEGQIVTDTFSVTVEEEKYLVGGEEDNELEGSSGNDRIFGGMGDDSIFGGMGDDFLIGLADNDLIEGGEGDDYLVGYHHDDSILGNEGDDTLFGNQGNDDLDGGADSDLLSGGAGDDLLNGGAGNDTLWGKEGADIFVLEPGSGWDVINDFTDGIDRIGLAAGLVWSELTVVGSDEATIIDSDDRTLAVLSGVDASLISIEDVMLDFSTQASPYSNIYVFGDSLSDMGNLFNATTATQQFLSTFDLDFPVIPASPPYFEGRFSNGPVWVEKLAEELDIELTPATELSVVSPDSEILSPITIVEDNPVVSPFFNGNTVNQSVNFAYGSAETGANGTSELGDFVPGMARQVEFFIGDHLQANQPADRDALYILWGGSNDYLAPNPDPEQIVDNLETQVESLYGSGARNFLIVNLPDLGSIPEANNPDLSASPEELTALVDTHNSLLDSTFEELSDTLTGADLTILDINSVFDDVLSNPEEFGLTNVTEPLLDPTTLTPTVGADPDEYFFFDTLHPTEAAHEIIYNNALTALDLESEVML